MAALSEGLVYVDEHLLVLEKPAGLLAVPGRGADKQDCLATRAQRLWPDALVVHRLDMATSGLFLIPITQSTGVSIVAIGLMVVPGFRSRLKPDA